MRWKSAGGTRSRDNETEPDEVFRLSFNELAMFQARETMASCETVSIFNPRVFRGKFPREVEMITRSVLKLRRFYTA